MKKYRVFTIIAILTAVLMMGGTGCSTSKTTTLGSTQYNNSCGKQHYKHR